ncbi:MAG: hypothetical protein EU539_01245 [Promethearchaeota archaeon]|nr:MAG: hypothetical protein EU539_01245 [Candidatus Lokiarchaeota archaeon]
MSQHTTEITEAIKLVKKASEITEWFRKKGFENLKKKDRSPVSIADFASQIYIINQLRQKFPDDQIFAEENEVDLINDLALNRINECFEELNVGEIEDLKSELQYRGQNSERQWSIDPIDGTAGYMEGLTYAIGIGFMINSIPMKCAISVPDHDDNGEAIFIAEKNNGAKASYGGKDFIPLHVSKQNKVTEARLCQSLHYDLPWVSQFAEKIGIKKRIKLDSMAKFCMIAEGRYELYIKPAFGLVLSSWDYCPGDLLVREAGGKVTDLDEEPLKYDKDKCILRGPGIIVSNGILHDQVSVFIRNNFFSV